MKWSLRQYCNDLSLFINLLKDTYKLDCDYSTLESMLTQLRSGNYVDYNTSVIFFIKGVESRKALPKDLSYRQIIFNNLVKEKDVHYDLNQDDPLYDFRLEINIHAYQSKLASDRTINPAKFYKNYWHLDKHYDRSNVKCTHPTYHFQFGGSLYNSNVSVDTGEIYLLGSPRIPHPPMDIFLGFHFILSNFYKINDKIKGTNYQINDLLNNHDYKTIIQRAQERLWTPYFKGLNVNNQTHNDFKFENIFPLYIT